MPVPAIATRLALARAEPQQSRLVLVAASHQAQAPAIQRLQPESIKPPGALKAAGTALPVAPQLKQSPASKARAAPLEQSLSEDFSIPDEEIGENSHAIPRVINSQRLQQGASNRGDPNSQLPQRLPVRGASQPSDSQLQSQGQGDSSSSFNLQNEYLMQQLIMARGSRTQAQQADAFEALGTQKDGNKPVSDKGLHPFQLDQLIAFEFNKEKVKSEDPSKLECCICLVPYQTGVLVKVLQCVHTFHAKCIDEWLVKKSICPECNFNLRSVDPRQLA